jgi:hypothetical protein
MIQNRARAITYHTHNLKEQGEPNLSTFFFFFLFFLPFLPFSHVNV